MIRAIDAILKGHTFRSKIDIQKLRHRGTYVNFIVSNVRINLQLCHCATCV